MKWFLFFVACLVACLMVGDAEAFHGRRQQVVAQKQVVVQKQVAVRQPVIFRQRAAYVQPVVQQVAVKQYAAPVVFQQRSYSAPVVFQQRSYAAPVYAQPIVTQSVSGGCYNGGGGGGLVPGVLQQNVGCSVFY